MRNIYVAIIVVFLVGCGSNNTSESEIKKYKSMLKQDRSSSKACENKADKLGPNFKPKLVQGETYPTYYNDIEKIVLKDVMTRWFKTSKSGILSYGYEDAVKAGGHACYAVTGAFLVAREGLKALKKKYECNPDPAVTSSYDYIDKVMYRGGVKITMSGKEGIGNAFNAIGDVISYITGAEGASGFSHGPDFPFANRRNLFEYDSNLTGIQAIFTSMTATYINKEDNSSIDYDQCKGTWHKCIEKTTCDKSVKVSFKINTPKDKPWNERIKYVFDNANESITVEDVDNPKGICK